MKTLTLKEPVVFHFRFDKNTPPVGKGVTVVFNPHTKRFGGAICGSLDNFSRHQGISIATERTNSAGAVVKRGRSLRVTKKMTFAEIRKEAFKYGKSLLEQQAIHAAKRFEKKQARILKALDQEDKQITQASKVVRAMKLRTRK